MTLCCEFCADLHYWCRKNMALQLSFNLESRFLKHIIPWKAVCFCADSHGVTCLKCDWFVVSWWQTLKFASARSLLYYSFQLDFTDIRTPHISHQFNLDWFIEYLLTVCFAFIINITLSKCCAMFLMNYQRPRCSLWYALFPKVEDNWEGTVKQGPLDRLGSQGELVVIVAVRVVR